MDKRKRLILHAIIQDYITSAEPVGSRSLVKRHQIDLSPATIRNEMADLEEMGYLKQPHTSAGRIPRPRDIDFMSIRFWETPALLLRTARVEELISPQAFLCPATRQLARLLASVTNYLSLIAEPSDIIQEIRHINIVPLSATRAICLVVLSDGSVRHHSLSIPEGVTPGD